MRRDEFVQLSKNVLQPKLPCLGYVKIGGKGKQMRSGQKTWYLPTKYDHFKVTTRARGAGENFVLDQAVHDIVGREPRELDIRLLYNEPHQNFQTSLQAYDKKQLRCKGNGERAFDRILGREIPCTCPLLKQHVGDYPGDIPRPSGVACKPTGILSFFLEAAQTYGGFHVFKTTSWETIAGITAFLEHAKQAFGLLSFVPFKLKIYPRTVVYEEGGQQKSSLSYSVAIVLAASMDTAFQIAGAAREKQAEALQLTAGTYTPERHADVIRELEQHDQKDFAEEFHPDGSAVDADVIIEEEVDPLEQRIRRALELKGTSKIKINEKLAEYSDRMGELGAHVEEHFPAEWKQACEELAAAEAADIEFVDDDTAVEAVEPATPGVGDPPVAPAAAVAGDKIPSLFDE